MVLTKGYCDPEIFWALCDEPKTANHCVQVHDCVAIRSEAKPSSLFGLTWA